MEKISHSNEETGTMGRDIASTLTSGAIYCLQGELGAGKTTLVKGIAEGLGISDEITSPTFTLMNIYNVKNHPTVKNLVHIDTYRLKDEQELLDIGVEDYLGEPGIVTIIEWPEKIAGLLKDKKIVTITLEHLSGDERKIKI